MLWQVCLSVCETTRDHYAEFGATLVTIFLAIIGLGILIV